MFKLIVGFVNTPVVGNIYDYFYFNRIRRKLKTDRISITTEGHNICNLKCIMCPYPRMKRKKELMSMDLFKKIINDASELDIDIVYIQQQSEPFIDKYIFERIKYIRDKLPNAKIIAYSNGLALTKEIRDKILENPPDIIKFSFDGATKETYESIRVNSNFEIVVDNIKSLVKERNEKGVKLCIETYFTVLPNNKHEAQDFVKMWKGITDSQQLYPGDSRENEKFSLVNYRGLKQYPCFNPNFLNILSNGKVAPCCIDVDGDYYVGDLNKQTIKEVIESDKVREIIESQLNRRNILPICNQCSKLYVDGAVMWL